MVGVSAATRGVPADQPVEVNLEAVALELYDKGFNVLPVGDDKRPLGSWGVDRRLDLSELDRLFRSGRAKGVAIVAGPQNPVVGEGKWLVLIDVDRPDVLKEMPTLRSVIERTIAWRTGPRCPQCGSKHLEVLEPGRRWRCKEHGHEFTIEDNPPRGLGALAAVDAEDYKRYLRGTRRSKDVEILAANYQLVPPSLHPSGLHYEPIPNGAKEIAHVDSETLRRILEEIGKRAAPRLLGEGAAPAAGGLRRLGDDRISRLVELLDGIYRPGHRQMIWLYVSGWLAKEGVDPRDAARILAQLYSEHRDEDPISQRATALIASYRKASVDLGPYAEELEGILGTRVSGIARDPAAEELSLKGISGLEEIAAEVLEGPDRAHALAAELRGAIGSRPDEAAWLLREPGAEGRSTYELLYEVADEKVKELFRDEEGEVCAVVEEGDHLEVWPVESEAFDEKLNLWFYTKYGRGARRDVRRDVIETLKAKALGRGEERRLSLLCYLKESDDPIIIVDLLTPDWKGAIIRPDGVTIAPLPPTFRRPPHLGPLWNPEVPFRGEPREVMLDFLRRIIPEPEDPRTYDLLAPVLPALLLPIPRPILAFLGGHGSSKSFAQRMIVRALLRGQAPRPRSLDLEDMALTARDNPILFLDNVRRISEDLARFLAVAITGEAVGGRERYTDKGTVYYEFRRAILLNGIAPNVHSYPDVADRTLIIRLRRVPPEKRRPEGELEEELEPLLPRVFSASLEALRRALGHLWDARNDLRGSLPRMADFAVWGEAIARGMGYAPREWFNLYQEWVGEATEEAVEMSALGRGILKLGEMLAAKPGLGEMTLGVVEAEMEKHKGGVECIMDGKPTWAGTTRDLLRAIPDILGIGPEEAEREGLPRTPQGVGKELRDLQSSLQDLGVEISFRRGGSKKGTRLVLIQFARSPAPAGGGEEERLRTASA
jgi:transposase-like protein